MTHKNKKMIGLAAGYIIGALIGSALNDVVVVELLGYDSSLVHYLIMFVSAFAGGMIVKYKV